MFSTVTTKGQITIPKKIRDEFGIAPHKKVYFRKENGKIVIEPVSDFFDLAGTFTSKNGEKDVKKIRKETARRVAQGVVEESSGNR